MPDNNNIILKPSEINAMDDWELLRRITGKNNADPTSAADISDLLSSMLFDGRDISDEISQDMEEVAQGEVTLNDVISVYADVVRTYLSPAYKDNYITLFPDPRAVIIDTSDPDIDEIDQEIYDNKNIEAMKAVSLYTDLELNESASDIPLSPEEMDNTNDWDFLRRVTGIDANGNSIDEVSRLLKSIYINGERLSDTLHLGNEVSEETIETFSAMVRSALDPNSEDYGQVTIRDNDNVRIVNSIIADDTPEHTEYEYDDVSSLNITEGIPQRREAQAPERSREAQAPERNRQAQSPPRSRQAESLIQDLDENEIDPLGIISRYRNAVKVEEAAVVNTNEAAQNTPNNTNDNAASENTGDNNQNSSSEPAGNNEQEQATEGTGNTAEAVETENEAVETENEVVETENEDRDIEAEAEDDDIEFEVLDNSIDREFREIEEFLNAPFEPSAFVEGELSEEDISTYSSLSDEIIDDEYESLGEDEDMAIQDDTELQHEANEVANFRWFREGEEAGIREEEFDGLKFDPKASPQENSRKGFMLLSMLSATNINENSLSEDYKNALDKIVINGKTARDYFGIGDTPTKEDIIGVMPKLTNVMNVVFNGKDINGNTAEKPYISLKEDNRLIPLMLNTNHIGENFVPEAENENTPPEKISSRIVTRDEVKKYIKDQYYNKLASEMDSKGDQYTINKNAPIKTDKTAYKASNQYIIQCSNLYDEIAATCRKNDVYYPRHMEQEINRLKQEMPEKSENDIRNLADKNVVEGYIKQNFISIYNGKKEFIRRTAILMHKDGIRDLNTVIDDIIEKNIDNHNKYMKHEMPEEFKSEAENYNKMASVYAKTLNNEPSADAGKREANPTFCFSIDDISSDKAFIKALRDKEPSITLDDIYIGKKNLREITGITGNLKDRSLDSPELNSEVFSEIAENFRLMSNPFKWQKNPSGKVEMPFIGIKTAVGMVAPVITPGVVPEIKPEVKPLTGFQRFFSRASTVEKNMRDVEEYEESRALAKDISSKNNALKNVNEATRIYARAYNGQELTERERAFVTKFKINVPGSHVRETSLTELAAGDNSVERNAPGLTQPVIKSPEINEPERSTSM